MVVLLKRGSGYNSINILKKTVSDHTRKWYEDTRAKNVCEKLGTDWKKSDNLILIDRNLG